MKEGDVRKIADIQIQKLVDRMKRKGIDLDVEDSARQLLSEKGFDPSYGARPLKRAIQSCYKMQWLTGFWTISLERKNTCWHPFRMGN